MLYNLDDCFIIAKSSNELDDLVNAINNAESKNDESLERFYYLDDVLPYYSIDELKEMLVEIVGK
jgi:hypothetical protein